MESAEREEAVFKIDSFVVCLHDPVIIAERETSISRVTFRQMIIRLSEHR